MLALPLLVATQWVAGVVAVRLRWPVSKYRAIAEQLTSDLDDSQKDLEISEAKRISAEAIASERKNEIERLRQMLANAEAARDRSVQSMTEVNGKLLQVAMPEREPLWKRQQLGPDGAPMVAIPQRRTHRPPDPAEELYIATLKLQAEQRRKRDLAKKIPQPGTLPLAN
jgi:hypothetical protein